MILLYCNAPTGQRVTMIYTLGVTMGVNDNQNIIVDHVLLTMS